MLNQLNPIRVESLQVVVILSYIEEYQLPKKLGACLTILMYLNDKSSLMYERSHFRCFWL
ncbi:MAG: hypothetical protein ACK45Z_06405 [Dolichospermum sp.]